MQSSGEPTLDDDSEVPEPQGHIAGVPYDLRRPTVSRFRSRWWNPADARFFAPKTFGVGWDLNLYWLVHPAGYLLRRRSKK